MSFTPEARILAVSPGGRLSGVAVIDTPNGFRRFEVITTQSASSFFAKMQLFREKFGRLVAEEKPDLIVLDSLEGRSSRRTQRLMARAVRATARGAKIPVTEASLKAARRLVNWGDRPSRGALHQALVHRFPQLGPLTKQPSHYWSPKDRSYDRCFAALALAFAGADDLRLHGLPDLAHVTQPSYVPDTTT